MSEPLDLGLIAVRLEFSDGHGIILVEKEDGYTLFDVERFCWLNAHSIWGLLGSFVGATEMQTWPSHEAYDAWLAVPGNPERLIGFAGRVQVDVMGPIRLSDNAGATL